MFARPAIEGPVTLQRARRSTGATLALGNGLVRAELGPAGGASFGVPTPFPAMQPRSNGAAGGIAANSWMPGICRGLPRITPAPELAGPSSSG